MGVRTTTSTTIRPARALRASDLAPAVEVIAGFVESFDAPGCMPVRDAEALVTMFTRIERLGGAGKTLAATRAAEAHLP